MIYIIENEKKQNTYIINNLTDIINILKLDVNINNITELVHVLYNKGYHVTCHDNIYKYYSDNI